MFQQMMQVLVSWRALWRDPRLRSTAFSALEIHAAFFLIGSENILPMSRLWRI